MILGIFLALGGSFTDMKKSGQDSLFKKSYLDYFSSQFDQIYIYSYENEVVDDLPKNVKLVSNRFRLNRYFYGVLLPLLYFNLVRKSNVFRCYHLSGTVPAILGRIFFSKPFVFNYAYDYEKFTYIENKTTQAILLAILKPIAFLFASRIFAANRSFLKKLPLQKTFFLPNGVDIDNFKPMKSKITNKKKVILAVGRLEKQKNFINLVKALKGLNINLHIVGNGSLKNELLLIAKRNKVALEITDKIGHDKIVKVYNRADIFILPSLIEGHPKVLLEAMACGLAVVGTNVEGIKEIINDKQNGLLCKTSSTSIRQAISLLIKNKKLSEKLGKASREYVVQNYNLTSLLKKEVENIKNVI